MSSLSSLSTLSDDELYAHFEEARLPDGVSFHHADHVRVAWLYVRRLGMPDALGRFAQGLKRFAAQRGAPGLYHETITWAYLLLIAERETKKPALSWAAFATENAELLAWKPGVLERYYQPETLHSEVSRRQFVFPDKLPA